MLTQCRQSEVNITSTEKEREREKMAKGGDSEHCASNAQHEWALLAVPPARVNILTGNSASKKERVLATTSSSPLQVLVVLLDALSGSSVAECLDAALARTERTLADVALAERYHADSVAPDASTAQGSVLHPEPEVVQAALLSLKEQVFRVARVFLGRLSASHQQCLDGIKAQNTQVLVARREELAARSAQVERQRTRVHRLRAAADAAARACTHDVERAWAPLNARRHMLRDQVRARGGERSDCMQTPPRSVVDARSPPATAT